MVGLKIYFLLIQKNRKRNFSSYSGCTSNGWRYFIIVQRSDDPALKVRALDKEMKPFSIEISRIELESQLQGLGMGTWEAYFTFLKGVLCDCKGLIELSQVGDPTIIYAPNSHAFFLNAEVRVFDVHVH